MMSSLLQLLTPTTLTGAGDATLRDGGFASTAPSLAGKTLRTSPAVTRQILASPGFDQLSGSAKAAHILEIALA